MNIKVEKVLGRWLIHVDGVTLDTVDFAEKYKVSRINLTKMLSNSKNDYELYIRNLIWRVENNVSHSEVVFINPDMERCATSIIRRHIPDLEKTYIRKRLALWRDGLIDNDRLFQPPEMGKCGGSNMPGPSTASVTITEGSRQREAAAEVELKDMPARGRLEDIKVGTWEKENKHIKGRPTKMISSTSHGYCLFGE
jgi:hypothetical protein